MKLFQIVVNSVATGFCFSERDKAGLVNKMIKLQEKEPSAVVTFLVCEI